MGNGGAVDVAGGVVAESGGGTKELVAVVAVGGGARTVTDLFVQQREGQRVVQVRFAFLQGQILLHCDCLLHGQQGKMSGSTVPTQISEEFVIAGGQ